jgi:hypothetical protein
MKKLILLAFTAVLSSAIFSQQVYTKEIYSDSTQAYLSNINVLGGIYFYAVSKEELKTTIVYVIHNFTTEDLNNLNENTDMEKYPFEIIESDYHSVPGDLIYAEKNKVVSWYWHCESFKQQQNLSE